MKVRLSKAAEDDLDQLLVEGTSVFGAVQAIRYASDLAECLDNIAEFPRLGRERPELGPVRSFPFRAHVVIYRIDDEGIFVVRVRHGHEDIA